MYRTDPDPLSATAPGPLSADALHCDVLVVGGGINGAGIARDLAGRGWRVVLCERDDLAAHTSSASTKLIHGGLRYLEHGEFGLVRKALQERERLLRSAPHIMHALSFVMPHEPALRPAWLVRTGLWLYDHLARRDWLPASQAVDLRSHPAGAALQPRCRRGFVYSDGWVDDARLVALCAVDARERGATVLTRCACVQARDTGAGWHATLRDRHGRPIEVQARALVNAAGPWAARFLHEALPAVPGAAPARPLRLVKGSHIVVPQRGSRTHAYLFQGLDRRVVFAIPYEERFTLIGTTDVELHDAPETARADAAEIDYLCAQCSRYLAVPVTPADVVWSFAGVRPLLDDAAGDPSAVTRDYRLELAGRGAPLLTVWGGKLTTFRRLAEEAADRLGERLGERRPAWTAQAPLPGGDFAGWGVGDGTPEARFARFRAELGLRRPWLPDALATRLARAYGSRVERVLQDATRLADLGPEVAPGLHAAELAYLQREEWAVEADDVLWRRSKRGLHLDAAQRGRVAEWLATHAPGA